MQINQNACRIIGDYLNNKELKDPIYRLHGQTLEEKLFFILNFVSICHSINYDFLANALGKIMDKQPEKFNPDYLAKITKEELYDWLKEYPKKERIKIETRTEFINDLNQKLIDKYNRSALTLFNKTRQYIPDIYKELDIFKAFNEDPLRKKTSCVIGEINQNNLAKLTGWEYFRPQIDYHIARTILRNGLISLDAQEKNKLANYQPMDEKEATQVRSECIKALNEISKHSGQNIDDLRVFYWYIGRECCSEENPCCNKCTHEKPTYENNGSCMLGNACSSKKDKESRKLREPNFETTFY